MAEPPGPKPVGAVWRPVRDLPREAESWGLPSYRELVREWREARRRLENRKADRTLMDIWLRERKRAFAIETGQVENLYVLRRGVTEQLITEGFAGVRGAHSLIGDLSDETLRGLLEDQQETLEAVFDMATGKTPLGHHVFKSLHQVLTHHQDTAVGIEGLTGRRIQIPLRKGDYKIRPNNPRRPDGYVHEYCPPEQVRSELDRLLEFHHAHADRNLPAEVEAAWLHHEFVRVHPFQDGNGRMSRLLMAYVFVRNGEFPPIISTERRPAYIGMLEIADEGDLRPFIGHLAGLSQLSTQDAIVLADQILKGRNHYRHGNGGVTVNGGYHPPAPDEVAG